LDSKKYKQIVILGHHSACREHEFINKISTTRAINWSTPLGNIKIEKNMIAELLYGQELFVNDCEECPSYTGKLASIEMQLPYIQKIFRRVQLIPLMVGQLDEENLQQAAENLTYMFED
jgi:AmmeMemoRadiSam system protein B